jgi:hypothetical protein
MPFAACAIRGDARLSERGFHLRRNPSLTTAMNVGVLLDVARAGAQLHPKPSRRGG